MGHIATVAFGFAFYCTYNHRLLGKAKAKNKGIPAGRNFPWEWGGQGFYFVNQLIWLGPRQDFALVTIRVYDPTFKSQSIQAEEILQNPWELG